MRFGLGACVLLFVTSLAAGDAPPPKPWVGDGTAVMYYASDLPVLFESGGAPGCAGIPFSSQYCKPDTKMTLTFAGPDHYWINGTFILANPTPSNGVQVIGALPIPHAWNPYRTIGDIHLECRLIPDISEEFLVPTGTIHFVSGSRFNWQVGQCDPMEEPTPGHFRMFYNGSLTGTYAGWSYVDQPLLSKLQMDFDFPNMPGTAGGT